MACGSCAVSIRDDDVVGCLQPGAQAVSGFSPLQHRVTEWMTDYVGVFHLATINCIYAGCSQASSQLKNSPFFFYLQNTYKRNKLVGPWRKVLLALHVDKISAAVNLTCNPNDGSVTQWTSARKTVMLHNCTNGSFPLNDARPTGSSVPQKDWWSLITLKYSLHTAQ